MSTIASIRRRENRRTQRLPQDKSPDLDKNENRTTKKSKPEDNGEFLWSNIGGKLFYSNSEDDQGYVFNTTTILKLLVSLRVGSAFWSIILDCDETYNYWEPLHLLLFGRGFQTWEYSPEYGIRSWAYIYLHYLLSVPFLGITFSKVMLFTFIRISIALISMVSDLVLYHSICKRLGNSIGSYFVVLSMLSVAMFNASPAFLPSSFSMTMNTFAMAAYLQEYWFIAIFFTAFSALCGWPFAVVLGLPIVLEMVVIRTRLLFLRFVGYALLSGAIIFVPMYLVDSFYYGKPVIAPLNIVLYNVLSGHGPDLYGVEPVSYYLKNLFLNWNVALLFALIALPTALYVYVFKGNDNVKAELTLRFWYRFIPFFFIFLSVYLWITIFFLQPHKEERFLFPIFPLIAVLAAVGLDALNHIHGRFVTLSNLLIFGFVVLSISRGYALHRNYYASTETYKYLNDHFIVNQKVIDLDKFNNPIQLCVGKEWYRFPSSFYLPEYVVGKGNRKKKVVMNYLRSSFKGILPKHFSDGPLPEITSLIPTEMNDLNEEETGRYVKVGQCDYVVDLFTGGYSDQDDFNEKTSKNFKVLYEKDFLLNDQSHPLFRAFAVPFTSNFLKYGKYRIYERL
ncbi:unnamed protein product [Bursaphelenchus okinawaensis]|uniref:Mannosyltransferase n=1 Tax=Bursaphelenchus okinawaensis TaxID=465554 RepID=A0A811K906_9BILA|nr:unnamed protein product [Bursaphelenchus okinawaensis]CAG9095361.1 unnamed protein product [Bursaphelenchus okinawaensis]